MKKLSIRYIVGLTSFALVVLVSLQLYQANELYIQTSYELNKQIENVISQVVIRHEKASDFRRYSTFLDQDFSGQYRSALKQEFQSLVPVQESVSIRDTFIRVDGRDAKYLFITGKSYDSISDVTSQHSVLARDVSELSYLLQGGGGKEKEPSDEFGYQLDKRVITNLFKKSKYINEMMTTAFRSAYYIEASERIDIVFLDSIISTTFKSENLDTKFSYVITDEEGEFVRFNSDVKRYSEDIDTTKTFDVRLFPGNIFDEELTLHFNFPNRQSVLFSEMWLTLTVSILLIILIVISFYLLFKVIYNQKHLAEVKNDFISNMTHEFKTPISTISLACEALGDKDMVENADADTISPFVKMIKDENKRLSGLVESILQSAIIEKGELKMKNEPLELNEIVSSVVSKAKMRVTATGGKITLEQAAGLMPFKGDLMHTTNVVSNLIDNAIKYSKDKVDITVSTEKQDGQYIFTVTDKGIGIKNEYLDRIFDKLYRVPTGNVHDVKGFGLGLSYVKAIVDLKGWEINVKSKFGEGSTFTVIINKND